MSSSALSFARQQTKQTIRTQPLTPNLVAADAKLENKSRLVLSA